MVANSSDIEIINNKADLKIIDLLKLGADYLSSCQISDARAEADLLLAFVYGIKRDKLYIARDNIISLEKRKSYAELLKQRGQGHPLAYLQKTREFMGLDFYVDENVLIPRPESELLVEKALAICEVRFEGAKAQILDLCTGSGALAIAIAYFWPQAIVTATDISMQALKIAQQNAITHCQNIQFRQGDLFSPVRGQKFDLIISNPPYVSEKEYKGCSMEVHHEPSLALLGGEDGLDFYRRIADEISELLNPKGVILLEIGCSQGFAVGELFGRKNYQVEIFKDYAGHDRIVKAEKE